MKPLCIQSLFMPHTVSPSRNVSFHIFLCFCCVIYIFLISFLKKYFFSNILYNVCLKQDCVRSLPTSPVKKFPLPSPVSKMISLHVRTLCSSHRSAPPALCRVA